MDVAPFGMIDREEWGWGKIYIYKIRRKKIIDIFKCFGKKDGKVKR